jgi:hypothetical protein
VLRRIYAGLLDGNFKLSSDAEIGAANAQGRFHYINVYTQRRKDLGDPYVQSVFNVANEAFRMAASGNNTQAMYFRDERKRCACDRGRRIPAVCVLERRLARVSTSGFTTGIPAHHA